MGIPSYYRTLVRQYPHLVRAHAKPVDWLWMDYNCLIYHCLRRPDLRPYSKGDHDAWERDLIQAAVAYTKRVVSLVKPVKGVYIGIDGIVPMAKMRQQRLRRFKSAWLSSQGPAAEAWNTSAITPGTAFMRLLRTALEALVKSQKGWVLSSSDEPGEGEHKVMGHLLRCEPASHAIYGLDADLVVLSLLTQDTLRRTGKEASVALFREEVENGSLKRDAEGEEVFQWFSIDALRDILAKTVTVRDYCFAMTLLGNDFLPSSLSFKLRDGAHDELLRLLAHGSLLNGDDTVSVDGLVALLSRFSALEEERLMRFLHRKAKQAIPKALTVVGDETWPLSEQAEAFLMTSNWRPLYRAAYHGSPSAYLAGLQWVWDYYRSLDVCYNWYYPFSLPPLWSDLVGDLKARGLPLSPPVLLRKGDITTSDQLCLVLPLSSYHLVPSAEHRRFPALAPEFFPAEFGFDSMGKQFFWECEAEIPIPSLLEVKRILKGI